MITKNFKTGNYKEKRLEESQVIDLIIERSRCQYGNLDFFYDLMNVPRSETLTFDRYYIGKEILRTELGFQKNKKPGDFDILIIPAFKESIYYEYTAAFELKVVRPTNKNYRKNSNSLGTTQTFGLIDDGFPLVGLIQVCMNEPINPHQLQLLPNMADSNEVFVYDAFPLYSIETQFERVLKTDLPKYVGLNIFGLNFDQDENVITHHSSKFDFYYIREIDLCKNKNRFVQKTANLL